ncbi:hypothetical protein [Pseudogemmobacter faecipullorum]|uniref:YCII-related domain-containing protein n=1 Tax=Pseudogemmobacter faecipullorum TaxID=2755041 RepID=A0ABS8CKX7_9RHOB|nr:hypothetical protein [Pseudogemmobacter faecipullorum]MCB5410031.1 hypothetical protein [Pseudogemmobacter faecipullorum]
MPRFLAVYTLQPADRDRFRALPQEEQAALEARGVAEWGAWEARYADRILDPGGMSGKTTRVTREGIGPGENLWCGYLVVEAGDARAAAEMFVGHPHLTTFPGDGVDIMPLLT